MLAGGGRSIRPLTCSPGRMLPMVADVAVPRFVISGRLCKRIRSVNRTLGQTRLSPRVVRFTSKGFTYKTGARGSGFASRTGLRRLPKRAGFSAIPAWRSGTVLRFQNRTASPSKAVRLFREFRYGVPARRFVPPPFLHRQFERKAQNQYNYI